MDDPTLIRRIAEGAREDLGVLYDRYGAIVHRVAARVLLSESEADDVTQETFLKVWDGAAGYRGGSVKAWLVRIALNRSRDRMRARGRTRTLGDANGALPAPEPEGDERLIALRAALADLPPPERAALALRYYEKLSHEESSMALGVSVRTVKYRVARALAFLRRRIGDE